MNHLFRALPSGNQRHDTVAVPLRQLSTGVNQLTLFNADGRIYADRLFFVNRHDHAISGATMAFRILDKMGMPPEEVAAVITAIGHHDDSTAFPVNPVAAALILADKTDVRRSRVRNRDTIRFDIHDRVNYAVERSDVLLDVPDKLITLALTINTQVCAVMDYFEIFLQRMVLCRKAAEHLGLQFHLEINGQILL